MCEPPQLEELCLRTRQGLMSVIAQAVDQVAAMRRQEGQVIRKDLEGHCNVIERCADRIKKRSPQVVVDYQQRLQARVEELTREAKVHIDAEHLAREVALFAERSDVAEELSRLGGHVEQFRQAMDSKEPAGRKLEFIAQEMLREANTLASKANDARIAQAVVEIKTAVDRIKEQVQNVE